MSIFRVLVKNKEAGISELGSVGLFGVFYGLFGGCFLIAK
jgi:hypothetical protein